MKQEMNKDSNKERDIIMISKMYLKYCILKNEIFITIHIGHFSREKTNIKNSYTEISIQIYLLRYNRFNSR